MKTTTAVIALAAASVADSALAADYNANHFFAERH